MSHTTTVQDCRSPFIPSPGQDAMPNPFLKPGSKRDRTQPTTRQVWQARHPPLAPYRAFDDHTPSELTDLLAKMEEMNRSHTIQRHDSVTSISETVNLNRSDSTPVISSLCMCIKSWKPKKIKTWPIGSAMTEKEGEIYAHVPLISMRLDDDDELKRQCRVLFERLYNPHHGFVEQKRQRLYYLLAEHAQHAELRRLEQELEVQIASVQAFGQDTEGQDSDGEDKVYDEDTEALSQTRQNFYSHSSTPTQTKSRKTWSWKRVRKIATWPPKSRRVGRNRKSLDE